MRINELSALEVTVNLLEDDSTTAAAPTTAHWRLKCLESDTELQGWTEVTPSYSYDENGDLAESEVVIAVSATLHAMQTSNRKLERKALCISADKGLSTEWNDELIYEVERLNSRS